jgi:NitT/TauT family transport system substrate-binding protein
MRLSAASVLGPARRRRVRRLRPAAVVLVGLVPLLAVTGCNPLSHLSSAASGQQVTVGAVAGIDNANLYLAVHGGYFTRAGINVKIVHYHSVTKEIAALNGGNVDVISADYGDMFFTETVTAHPIFRILADGYDAAPGVIEIVTLPNSKIKNPSQLAGLQIPVPNDEQVAAPAGDPSTLAVASVTSVLQSDGVNLAGVSFEPMSQSQEIKELIKGQVPAVLLTGINVYLAQQQGAIELIDACSGPTSGIPLDGFFSTGGHAGWVTGNPTEAKAFEQGLYAADAAAALPGPIQSVLHSYADLTKQEARLVTTGTYPLSTIAANVQRTADMMQLLSMTKFAPNVAAMIAR